MRIFQRNYWSNLAQSLRPAFMGTFLFLLALFTWLTLLTSSQGWLTTAWIEGLKTLFGLGVWLFPLFIGAVGLWLVIHAIDRMPDIAWQRPLGCAMLFLAFIIGAALRYSPSTGWLITNHQQGGGRVGYLLAGFLEDTLSSWGAWAFVSFLTLSAITFIFETYVQRGINWLQLYIDQWRWQRQTRDVANQPPQQQPQQQHPEQPNAAPTGPQIGIEWWRMPVIGAGLRWWRKIERRWNHGTIERYTGKRPLIRQPQRQAHPGPHMAGEYSEQAMEEPPSGVAEAYRATQGGPHVNGNMPQPRIVGNAAEWHLPIPGDLLASSERYIESFDHIREQGKLIQDTLAQFGVPVSFEEVSMGPTVTQYLIKPGYIERTVKGEIKRVKIKVSKIAGLASDLALALAAPSVRIEAPIPGTRYVGVEVPNRSGNTVMLRDLMDSEEFQERRKTGKLPITLGEDVKGNPIVADLAKMPHLLIAGATGSGKSACINSIITCLLCTHTPDSLRMLMVDPKMVELNVYNGIPHLLSPVVTEVEKAAGVLYWAVKEMERRYSLLSKGGARDLERYNANLVKNGEKRLPFIVVIVDEMADLMMVAPEDVEKHICRLAQMARAVGIHMIIATQRPSVDVITGLIKANFPARISFAVTSQTDSRVIMDRPGAEALLGKGDMLFMSPDASKLERLQGTYVNDDEISHIARYWESEATRMERDRKGIRSLEGDAVSPQSISGQVPADHERADLPSLPGPSFSPTQPIDPQQPIQIEETALPKEPPRQLPEKSVRKRSKSASRAARPNKAQTQSVQPEQREPLEQPSLFDQVPKPPPVKGRDDLFEEAVMVVQEAQRASVSLLQRKLRVGFNRATRLVEQLQQAGVLGPELGEQMGHPVLIGNGQAAQGNRRMSKPKPKPRIIGDSDDGGEGRRPQVWM